MKTMSNLLYAYTVQVACNLNMNFFHAVDRAGLISRVPFMQLSLPFMSKFSDSLEEWIRGHGQRGR